MMASIIGDTEKHAVPYERIGERLDLFSARAHQNALALRRFEPPRTRRAIVVYTTSETAQLGLNTAHPYPSLLSSEYVNKILSFSWRSGSNRPGRNPNGGLTGAIDEELQKAELVEKGETIALTKVPLASGQRTNTMLLRGGRKTGNLPHD